MIKFKLEIERLVTECGNDAGAISRMIRHFASLPTCTEAESYRILMEMKVLALLRENLIAHPVEVSMTSNRFWDLPGFRTLRGVFSPEFATDSYLWARDIAQRGIVKGKSVLEMGAGTGIISFLLNNLSTPSFLCVVDVNPFAVENLRGNASSFGLDEDRFMAIKSDLMEAVPVELRFDAALWAMPWIFRDNEEIRCILREAKDPIKKALLRSAIDPSAESVKRFLSDVRPFLYPGGKVLLITSDFIPNTLITDHAEIQGYTVICRRFAEAVTVVEKPEIKLDLCELELTKQDE